MAPWWKGLRAGIPPQLERHIPRYLRVYFGRLKVAFTMLALVEILLAIFFYQLIMKDWAKSRTTITELLLPITLLFCPYPTIFSWTIDSQQRALLCVVLGQLLQLIVSLASWGLVIARSAKASVVWGGCGLVVLPALVGFIVALYLHWNMFLVNRSFGQITFGGGETPELTRYTDEDEGFDEGILARIYRDRVSEWEPDTVSLYAQDSENTQSHHQRGDQAMFQDNRDRASSDSESSNTQKYLDATTADRDKGKKPSRYSQELPEELERCKTSKRKVHFVDHDPLIRWKDSRNWPSKSGGSNHSYKKHLSTCTAQEFTDGSQSDTHGSNSSEFGRVPESHKVSPGKAKGLSSQDQEIRASSSRGVEGLEGELDEDILERVSDMLYLLSSLTSEESQPFLALLTTLEESQQREALRAMLFQSSLELKRVVSSYSEEISKVIISLPPGAIEELRDEARNISLDLDVQYKGSQSSESDRLHTDDLDMLNDHERPSAPRHPNSARDRGSVSEEDELLRTSRTRRTRVKVSPKLPWQITFSPNLVLMSTAGAIAYDIVHYILAIWAAVATVISGWPIDWINIVVFIPPLLTIPAIVTFSNSRHHPSQRNAIMHQAVSAVNLLVWSTITALALIRTFRVIGRRDCEWDEELQSRMCQMEPSRERDALPFILMLMGAFFVSIALALYVLSNLEWMIARIKLWSRRPWTTSAVLRPAEHEHDAESNSRRELRQEAQQQPHLLDGQQEDEDRRLRERDERRASERERRIRWKRRGKKLGEGIWNFVATRAIPVMVWPLAKMIEGMDTISNEIIAMKERQNRARLRLRHGT